LPTAATSASGGAALSSTWRTTWAQAAGAFLQAFAAGVVGGATEQLGSIAYRRNNAPLATPVFYPYQGGIIHGRLDTQRRRLGKESAYP